MKLTGKKHAILALTALAVLALSTAASARPGPGFHGGPPSFGRAPGGPGFRPTPPPPPPPRRDWRPGPPPFHPGPGGPGFRPVPPPPPRRDWRPGPPPFHPGPGGPGFRPVPPPPPHRDWRPGPPPPRWYGPGHGYPPPPPRRDWRPGPPPPPHYGWRRHRDRDDFFLLFPLLFAIAANSD